MDNMTIWESCRTVPETALKEIKAGRLKGKSDINPVWRLKLLTELFGPCGIGWKYVITKQWLETGGNGEIAAFVNIDLYIKNNDEWSEAIPGTGGSSFVANESKGPYVSDECFKMALTDAISVSCKALGVGADVYWSADATKYNRPTKEPSKASNKEQDVLRIVMSKLTELGMSNQEFANYLTAEFGKTWKELTPDQKSRALTHLTELAAGA